MNSIPHPRTWNTSAWLLVAANLAPVYGIIALGWSAGPLLWFYWFENLVVGVAAMARIAMAPPGIAPAGVTPPGTASPVSKAFLIPFFAAHYGMFCFVHGVFLGVITSIGQENSPQFFDLAPALSISGIGWMILALVLSHGWSFFAHYLRNGERHRTSAQAEMARPYGRVVVMHLTVMIGGAALILFRAPLLAALGLLTIKTLVDLRAHFRAHAAPSAPLT